MENHQLINSDSGSDEYFTPQHIIESARIVMGSIDLDPASSVEANKRVGDSRIFTIYDDGLNQEWAGNVWLNHPFGRYTNKPWISKLVGEWAEKRISSATCICFASTSELWFRPLLEFPQCFINGRTNYYLPDGTIKKGVTKGSVVTYLGQNVSLFHQEFSKIGTVKVPYKP